jgi:hypothetical protein
MTDTVTRLMQLAEHWADCSYHCGGWNASQEHDEQQYQSWLDESAKAEKALRDALEEEFDIAYNKGMDE